MYASKLTCENVISNGCRAFQIQPQLNDSCYIVDYLKNKFMLIKNNQRSTTLKQHHKMTIIRSSDSSTNHNRSSNNIIVNFPSGIKILNFGFDPYTPC